MNPSNKQTFFKVAEKVIHSLGWNESFYSRITAEDAIKTLHLKYDEHGEILAFNLQEISDIPHYLDIVQHKEGGFYLQFAYFVEKEDEENENPLIQQMLTMSQNISKKLTHTITSFNETHGTDFCLEPLQFVDSNRIGFDYHDFRVHFSQELVTNHEVISSFIAAIYPCLHLNWSLPMMINYAEKIS